MRPASFDLAPGYAALAELPRRRRRRAASRLVWVLAPALVVLAGSAAMWLLR